MNKSHGVLCFDNFEVDIDAMELRKDGRSLAVREKLFRVLATLLVSHGELVSREKLHSVLWPKGVTVDFDHNLNNVVARLRCLLSDPSDCARLIETVGSRGYRFIGRVTTRQKESGADDNRIRLAVLPFKSLNTDEEKVCITTAITEEIITALGRVLPHRLGVIAQTSILRYAATTKSIGQIGRELRVAYLLEGAVQVVSQSIHITCRLIRSADQTQMWSAKYDYDSGELLTIESDVAGKIAQALIREITGADVGPPQSVTICNREAYVQHLKGRYHQARRTGEDLQQSVECFERAIRLDPTSAPSHASLAISYVLLGWGGFSNNGYLAKAKESAVKALRLDDTIADSHTALALVKLLLEWEFPAAERLIRQALTLNQSDPYSLQVYCYYQFSKGDLRESILASERARSLDPLSVSANTTVGFAYYLAREYDPAIAGFKSALELHSTSPLALMGLAAVYSQVGRFSEAIACLQTAQAHDPSRKRILAYLGAVYANAGMLDKSREVIAELHDLYLRQLVCPFDCALVHSALHESSEAFRWLSLAQERHAPMMVLLFKSDPRFDNLRGYSEFRVLLDRMHSNNLEAERL